MGDIVGDSVQVISSVGFPIFMCLLLVKMMKDNEEKNANVISDLRETINKNTIVLTQIYERLEGVKNEQ